MHHIRMEVISKMSLGELLLDEASVGFNQVFCKQNFFFFSQKNTPFISYKVLQMSYVQIPVGMR